MTLNWGAKVVDLVTIRVGVGIVGTGESRAEQLLEFEGLAIAFDDDEY